MRSVLQSIHTSNHNSQPQAVQNQHQLSCTVPAAATAKQPVIKPEARSTLQGSSWHEGPPTASHQQGHVFVAPTIGRKRHAHDHPRSDSNLQSGALLQDESLSACTQHVHSICTSAKDTDGSEAIIMRHIDVGSCVAMVQPPVHAHHPQDAICFWLNAAHNKQVHIVLPELCHYCRQGRRPQLCTIIF